MISRKEIKKVLPHGSLTKIASKAGVSKTAVSKFFNGETKSSPIIQKVALQMAIKIKKDMGYLETKFNATK